MLTDIIMRHFTWIFILLFFGINDIVNSQDLRALDNNNGFQNYKFGMHSNQFQNCAFETVKDGGAKRCIIERPHKIGDIQASGVQLFFVDSKLSKIAVHFPKANDSSKLLKAIEAAFGEASSRENFPRYREVMGRYVEEPGSHNSLSPKVTVWSGDNVILRHKYREPISSFAQEKNLRLTLEYELKNYQELKNEYRSKKYTPSDF